MKRKYYIAIAVIVAASLFSELVMLSGHAGEHWWSRIPAFYALLGWVGCAVVIFVPKLLGKLFILKKEDYYDTV